MQIAGVGIIAFVVYEVSQYIFAPSVDGLFPKWGDKQRLAVVMLLCCVVGVLLALAISANMLVGVQGIDPSPLGAMILTGIVSGFGSGAVEQVAALGKGATQVVVGAGQSVLAQGQLTLARSQATMGDIKLMAGWKAQQNSVPPVAPLADEPPILPHSATPSADVSAPIGING